MQDQDKATGSASVASVDAKAKQDTERKITRQADFSKESCTVISTGAQIPPGTVGYRNDILPTTTVKHGIAGSHYNLAVATYNSAGGYCFWVPSGTMQADPRVVFPGAIPLEPIR